MLEFIALFALGVIDVNDTINGVIRSSGSLVTADFDTSLPYEPGYNFSYNCRYKSLLPVPIAGKQQCACDWNKTQPATTTGDHVIVCSHTKQSLPHHVGNLQFGSICPENTPFCAGLVNSQNITWGVCMASEVNMSTHMRRLYPVTTMQTDDVYIGPLCTVNYSAPFLHVVNNIPLKGADTSTFNGQFADFVQDFTRTVIHTDYSMCNTAFKGYTFNTSGDYPYTLTIPSAIHDTTAAKPNITGMYGCEDSTSTPPNAISVSDYCAVPQQVPPVLGSLYDFYLAMVIFTSDYNVSTHFPDVPKLTLLNTYVLGDGANNWRTLRTKLFNVENAIIQEGKQELFKIVTTILARFRMHSLPQQRTWYPYPLTSVEVCFGTEFGYNVDKIECVNVNGTCTVTFDRPLFSYLPIKVSISYVQNTDQIRDNHPFTSINGTTVKLDHIYYRSFNQISYQTFTSELFVSPTQNITTPKVFVNRSQISLGEYTNVQGSHIAHGGLVILPLLFKPRFASSVDSNDNPVIYQQVTPNLAWVQHVDDVAFGTSTTTNLAFLGHLITSQVTPVVPYDNEVWFEFTFVLNNASNISISLKHTFDEYYVGDFVIGLDQHKNASVFEKQSDGQYEYDGEFENHFGSPQLIFDPEVRFTYMCVDGWIKTTPNLIVYGHTSVLVGNITVGMGYLNRTNWVRLTGVRPGGYFKAVSICTDDDIGGVITFDYFKWRGRITSDIGTDMFDVIVPSRVGYTGIPINPSIPPTLCTFCNDQKYMYWQSNQSNVYDKVQSDPVYLPSNNIDCMGYQELDFGTLRISYAATFGDITRNNNPSTSRTPLKSSWPYPQPPSNGLHNFVTPYDPRIFGTGSMIRTMPTSPSDITRSGFMPNADSPVSIVTDGVSSWTSQRAVDDKVDVIGKIIGPAFSSNVNILSDMKWMNYDNSSDWIRQSIQWDPWIVKPSTSTPDYDLQSRTFQGGINIIGELNITMIPTNNPSSSFDLPMHGPIGIHVDQIAIWRSGETGATCGCTKNDNEEYNFPYWGIGPIITKYSWLMVQYIPAQPTFDDTLNSGYTVKPIQFFTTPDERTRHCKCWSGSADCLTNVPNGCGGIIEGKCGKSKCETLYCKKTRNNDAPDYISIAIDIDTLDLKSLEFKICEHNNSTFSGDQCLSFDMLGDKLYAHNTGSCDDETTMNNYVTYKTIQFENVPGSQFKSNPPLVAEQSCTIGHFDPSNRNYPISLQNCSLVRSMYDNPETSTSSSQYGHHGYDTILDAFAWLNTLDAVITNPDNYLNRLLRVDDLHLMFEDVDLKLNTTGFLGSMFNVTRAFDMFMYPDMYDDMSMSSVILINPTTVTTYLQPDAMDSITSFAPANGTRDIHCTELIVPVDCIAGVYSPSSDGYIMDRVGYLSYSTNMVAVMTKLDCVGFEWYVYNATNVYCYDGSVDGLIVADEQVRVRNPISYLKYGVIDQNSIQYWCYGASQPHTDIAYSKVLSGIRTETLYMENANYVDPTSSYTDQSQPAGLSRQQISDWCLRTPQSDLITETQCGTYGRKNACTFQGGVCVIVDEPDCSVSGACDGDFWNICVPVVEYTYNETTSFVLGDIDRFQRGHLLLIPTTTSTVPECVPLMRRVVVDKTTIKDLCNRRVLLFEDCDNISMVNVSKLIRTTRTIISDHTFYDGTVVTNISYSIPPTINNVDYTKFMYLNTTSRLSIDLNNPSPGNYAMLDGVESYGLPSNNQKGSVMIDDRTVKICSITQMNYSWSGSCQSLATQFTVPDDLYHSTDYVFSTPYTAYEADRFFIVKNCPTPTSISSDGTQILFEYRDQIKLDPILYTGDFQPLILRRAPGAVAAHYCTQPFIYVQDQVELHEERRAGCTENGSPYKNVYFHLHAAVPAKTNICDDRRCFNFPDHPTYASVDTLISPEIVMTGIAILPFTRVPLTSYQSDVSLQNGATGLYTLVYDISSDICSSDMLTDKDLDTIIHIYKTIVADKSDWCFDPPCPLYTLPELINVSYNESILLQSDNVRITGFRGQARIGNNTTCPMITIEAQSIQLSNLLLVPGNCNIDDFPILATGLNVNNLTMSDITVQGWSSVINFKPVDNYIYADHLYMVNIVSELGAGPFIKLKDVSTLDAVIDNCPVQTNSELCYNKTNHQYCNLAGSNWTNIPTTQPVLTKHENGSIILDGRSFFDTYLSNQYLLKRTTQECIFVDSATNRIQIMEYVVVSEDCSSFDVSPVANALHVVNNPYFCFEWDRDVIIYVLCDPCNIGFGNVDECDNYTGVQVGTTNKTHCIDEHSNDVVCNMCALRGNSCVPGYPWRCIYDLGSSITRYACDSTGIVAVPGGSWAQYDCDNNTVLFPGYGYSTAPIINIETTQEIPANQDIQTTNMHFETFIVYAPPVFIRSDRSYIIYIIIFILSIVIVKGWLPVIG